ncbi:molecular chaperone HtpG [Salisediminibacterium selenitireducens]|uniref:Chaperone protein HtpG n=1 Tax=Bacillus selenitireducens (strain ATCC 700615 / DSM 15326 / MLS10) TaxID=439292 RepID=D6Y0C7_BACIE|nr:molecular chaperone HtpG [Salisediminibacterium selenitireducens]ADH98518.1 Heat shock protein Hsp90-like protein [[Bacillus] selenitireducens MLS10]
MEKKEFKAESRRLLEMMVNSIYSQREIFLRELISNASDAIDKMYYKALTDDSIDFNQDDFFIKISFDKDARTIEIKDTGIGMTKEELETNLGTIAESGSLAFKNENEVKDGHDIIGQFGVGFYSSFMVAKEVVVETLAYGSDQAYRWTSDGVDGYTIEESDKKKQPGTRITLHLKDATDDEDSFDEFLSEHRLRSIIKKYSDFIRYPIKLDVTKHEPKEDGEEGETVETVEEQTVNSMVPIWRKNKDELTDEDYENFYQEKRYGFDKPLKHVHLQVDGTIRYHSILYIPESVPFDYYSKEFEKGLELYSSGVLIMEKAPELVPDYFSFVKGMVDSEDLSLNISREILQQDRQLKAIAKNIKNKIKNELKNLLKEDREKYVKFFESFGRQLKYGVYSDFGQNKDDLQDLLMFHSSKDKDLVTLKEYTERMAEDQPYIYYATGDSVSRIEKLPQTERVLDQGYEILYFTEDVDEFAIKMMMTYDEKEFRNVSSGDLGLKDEESDETTDEEKKEHEDLFKEMKELLGDKVKDVRTSKRLKSHPVCLTAEGDISIEMEKVLAQIPENQGVQADKVLEINANHAVFSKLKQAHEAGNKEQIELYTNLLYNQALLIEGLPIEDPVAFTNDMWKLQ